jgi:hypothetical protein
MTTPFRSVLVAVALLAAGAAAQRVHLAQQLPEAPPSPAQPAGDGTEVLWNQSVLGSKAWIDQAFADIPASSTFQACDFTVPEDTLWSISRITAWYTQGYGQWSPTSITSAHLSLFPMSAALPDDLTDGVPGYEVPVTLTDVGGTVWELAADTSGIAELQELAGSWWIGLTPSTSWAAHGQEYRIIHVASGITPTAVRNPGGGLALGTGWKPLGALDTGGLGGPYEGSLRLEGVSETPPPPPPPPPDPGWTSILGTGLPSQTWFGLVPTLVGTGLPVEGHAISLAAGLAGAPGDVSFLVIGLEPSYAPLHGGILVPEADLVLPMPLGSFGNYTISTTWPPGIPPGLSAWFQSWTHEAGGTLGWCATYGQLLVTG